jgi:hypothetical protein
MRSRLHAQHYIPRLADSHLTGILFRADYRVGRPTRGASRIANRGLSRGPTGTARAKAAGFTVNEGHLWWKCDPRHGA